MTHTTEDWHYSPLPEGVSHAVTVPPGRGGGRSGGPSGQTWTGTQDGDLQSGTDNGGHGGAGSSGGHGRWSLWPWPLQPEPFLPPKKISLGKSGGIRSPPGLNRQDSTRRCLLFKSGLTQGMRQLKPLSCIRLCVVVLEALTPAAVHSLWISPTFLNEFCFTILSRVRLSLLLVHFFLPHLFLPFASLLMCLDTELCEQPASFAMTFCVLPSLCKVSMVVFWTTVKSAVFPMIV